MTVKESVRVLADRWVIVTSVLALALIAAGALWWLEPKQYTANLSLYVSARTADSAEAAFEGAQLSQQRVTSYVALLSSTRVTREVVRDLDLDMTPEELSGRIEASSPIESVLLDLAVTDGSPERAAAIANALSGTFIRIIDQLERPVVPGAQPPVAVHVVEPATIPEDPSSMGLPMTLAVGALVGLIAAVGAALVRNAFDSSIRNVEQLRDAAGAPSLGMIEFDRKMHRRPLTVHDDPHSVQAEGFRQLRTNLQFADAENPPKVIAVTSALPGEGKTSTLANLAIALASAGDRVLVVEADLRRPTLTAVLKKDLAVGLTSVLTGRARVDQAISSWSPRLDILPAGPLPSNPSELLAAKRLRPLLAELRGRYDAVLIDTPPLLPVTDASAVAPLTDGVILVCRYKTIKRRQVTAAVQALQAVSAPLLGTVFTMVPVRHKVTSTPFQSFYLPATTAPAVNLDERSGLVRPGPLHHNGPIGNGQPEQPANGQAGNGQAAGGQSGDGQKNGRQPVNGPLSNGTQGNGTQGNGTPGNGTPGNGLIGPPAPPAAPGRADENRVSAVEATRPTPAPRPRAAS